MQNSARGSPARARADPLVLSRILTDIDEFCSCCSRIRSLQGVCIEIQCKCTEGDCQAYAGGNRSVILPATGPPLFEPQSDLLLLSPNSTRPRAYLLRMLGLWSYNGEGRSTAGGGRFIIYSPPEPIRLFILPAHAAVRIRTERPPCRRSCRFDGDAASVFVFTHNTQRCRSPFLGLFSVPRSSGPTPAPCVVCFRRVTPAQVPHASASGQPPSARAFCAYGRAGFESGFGACPRSAGRNR